MAPVKDQMGLIAYVIRVKLRQVSLDE